jgi:hypothetical protein
VHGGGGSSKQQAAASALAPRKACAGRLRKLSIPAVVRDRLERERVCVCVCVCSVCVCLPACLPARLPLSARPALRAIQYSTAQYQSQVSRPRARPVKPRCTCRGGPRSSSGPSELKRELRIQTLCAGTRTAAATAPPSAAGS